MLEHQINDEGRVVIVLGSTAEKMVNGSNCKGKNIINFFVDFKS